MMNVVGIVQARMNSTRLPGKILFPLLEQTPSLVFLIKRLQKIKINWWLATTDQSDDDITEQYGRQLGINVFRGSEQDVLSRFEKIAKITKCDWIVRVTADNPLTDPFLISRLIEQANCVSKNIEQINDSYGERNFPQGIVPSIVRTNSLLKIRKKINHLERYHFVHVTSKIPIKNTKKISFANFQKSFYGGARLTIDTYEDFQAVTFLIKCLGRNAIDCTFKDIDNALKKYPEILSINANILHKKIVEG